MQCPPKLAEDIMCMDGELGLCTVFKVGPAWMYISELVTGTRIWQWGLEDIVLAFTFASQVPDSDDIHATHASWMP